MSWTRSLAWIFRSGKFQTSRVTFLCIFVLAGTASTAYTHTHIHHENPKNLVRPVPKYAKGFGLSGSCFTRLTHDPEENAIFLAVACEVRVPTVGVRADLTHLVSPGHPT